MNSNESPLSQGQRALWFLQRLRPEAAAWNIAAAARVRGRLDSARLRHAFERLTERHEALRLSFHPTPDGPVQRLREDAGLDFREEEWEEGLLQREAERPFDLERDPLLRVRLLRTGGDDIVLLVIHHLIADLGSLALIVRELGPLYEGGLPAPPPTPYTAFVATERERLEGRAAERHWTYWRERLAGELPVCELPADRPRPPVRSFRGGSCTRRMRLELPASRAFPFLVAGLDVLLHRMSGQTDLLIGSPMSGRLAPGFDDTLGYFVNPVVLRSDLSGSPTFGQLLERVRGIAMGALRHQEYPFPLLVERLQPERDPARPPVFQVMLAFQRTHLRGTGDLATFSLGIEGAEVRTGPLVLESLPLERHFSQFDLELMAAETSRGLELALVFNADLFEPATAERLLRHLATLLEAAAEDSETRISELPLLAPEEIAQLASWNRTEAEVPREPVHQLFRRWAESTPDALAVVWEGGRLTYGELARQVDSLAGRLRAQGVGPETVVALRLERSPELVTAALAVLEAGGAYLPIDPANPKERAGWILEDSGALLELTAIPEGEGTPFPVRTDPDSLAYVIYTSGSTGRPKGVELRHRGLSSLIAWHCRILGLEPSDRTALVASPGVDVSVFEMWTALTAGASLYVPPPDRILSPPALLAWAAEQRITVLSLPTPLAEAVLAEPLPEGLAIRVLFTGGDRLRLRPAPGIPFALINHYGPTEGTIVATSGRVDPKGEGNPHIGSPIANTRAHVLDRDFRPVPVGVAGELGLAGEGLARAYRGRPDLTAERFVPNPMPESGGGRGERLYRTGDLVRWRPDGHLEYLGRLDRQIKVRGVRIEPGEIEAALLRHPEVREAAVDLRPGPSGEPVLVAWVAGPISDLRSHLRQLLPEALVPATFVFLPALPLTPAGKVDRDALVGPAPSDRPQPRAGTQFEELLAGIWSEVLQVERVLPEDDFFELGGHSLLATQVVARVRKVFGVELPLQALFEEPTLAGLARQLRELAIPSTSPVRRVSREGRLPLSYAQQRLWFLHRLDPDSPAYDMPGLVHLSAGPAEIQACLSRIVARHEALRTTFPETDGEPWQEIVPPARVELPVIDLAALPDPIGEARRLAAEEARRPFDLVRGPLLRTFFLQLGHVGHGKHRLLLNIHHAVADGWSLEILARELSALLRGEALPELPVQYADYAAWERAQPEAQLGWWLDELAGDLPPLELPLDRARPPRQRHRGASLPVLLPPGTVQGLRQLARAVGATPFMVLLTAFQALLHRLSGQDDIRVGVPVANRHRVEIEGLIGLFVNTLVLRTRFGIAHGLRESVESVRRTALGAFLHQDIPFGRLVDELQPERDPSRTPLFQAMLALQPAGDSPFLVEEIGNGTAKLELTLSLRLSGDRIEGWIEHDTDLFDGISVLRWARYFQTLLDAGLADPERPVTELPLLGPEETGQLLREWNDNRSPFPETCVHLLFDAQAERSPDAIALSCGGVDLSYRELAARANGLAHRLRRLGVGPEVAVGLPAERSIETVVGLLAILKAGGLYVPLDPSYPQERLDGMIEDSGVRFVLSPGQHLGEPLSAPVLPESLAYTIFTSGSTGRPKGVQVPHRALASFLASMAGRLREDDVLLAVTTLSFDIAALEILLPLIVGARVVVASREVAADGALLAAEIARSGATVLQATPSTWQMLIESGWSGSPGLTALCGGEALPRELARGLLDRTSALWNLYGPTETTVWSSACRVDRTVSIGRPLANESIHLVDRRLQPLPIGVEGELLIGGAGLARGYSGRPDLTAERFLPNPFGEPGARLYRTGDLARRLPDGRLEILGRLDQQVKVRGFRIELGEVEAALEAHPAVSRAVAAVRDGRLAAYTVGGAGPAELRAWLARRLPGPMIPSLFMTLDALPLTPNGKVDRLALPDPGPAPDLGETPDTPDEAALAEIWEEVLGIEGVGRHRSFFELGGHSLLATRLISRVNQAFRTDLPLRALFEAPTLEGLALLVRRGQRLPLPDFRSVPRGGPLAPSFAQERLWVMDRLSPGSTVYNLFQALELSGPLDETELERAFSEVARRHETLRTRFTTVQGRPMQIVEPHRFRPLPVVDLRSLPLSLRQGEADRLSLEEARRPFDLLRGPLVRIGLLRLGESSRLLLTLHHIICDGWSLDLLVREVGGQSLPELPFQYADYADWQRRWPAELLDGQLSWWQERLAGLSTLELPTDRPRLAAQSFRGGVVSTALPALPRGRRATPFMTMLAAWQILLHRLTGQTDVVVGSPVANRGRREIEDLVGFFVNNLVLRVDLSGNPAFAEVLGRSREAVLSAHACQDLPFERLVSELEPERDLSRSPLFQVSFSIREALPPLRGRLLDIDTGTSRFDLWLQIAPQEDGGTARAEYASDLFDAVTIQRWLGHLRVLLEGIAASPDTPISELPLLSPAERHNLLEWNGGEERKTTIRQLFEQQAARTPDALALLWDGGQLTYAELNAWADRLALGMWPGMRVAVLAERSPELVAALLAVFKAGATYTPLDPELPAERRALLLEDLPDPADGLAYILHTSGSTGRPKPVGVTHEALAEHILAVADLLELSERDRALFFASPAFDVSLEQLLSALVRGAAVVLRGPEVWPPAEFSRIAGRLGLTVAELPTAYWRQWVREASAAVPAALRLVTAGGEAMPAADARLWLQGPLAGVRLLNAYGPTEGVITASFQEVDAAAASGPGTVALGRLLPGRRAFVMDRHGQLQPPGVPGELCLGGRLLARGYLGRPDLTAERFVPDPTEPGARLYRTGDLVRRLPDGNLQFLGRTDQQVKIRGFRIELEEIEAVLLQHPGVREAAVASREDRPNDRRLVAYYVPGPEPDQLRSWLRGKLPEYMVPSAFVPVEALPRTPGGKVDRRALPAPSAEPAPAGEAPRTPTEMLVAGVFAEVLGTGEVPREVSFFDLGGNSLMATQVVTLLQDVLPVQLDLRKVFEGPTVAHVAEILEEERSALPLPEQLAMEEILAELLIQTQRD
ncbi:MAG TPA: amino acid adenylation domain-containing protein [Thermoanaerobaculia bacterium]|nr:amino acid adenylation domain-containing protein [Thermoanaerobaculia bacterium]